MQEPSVFRVGRDARHRDLFIRNKTSTNMDMLWHDFHAKQDYPEFYLGPVQKMALCICPETNREERHNINCLLMECEPKRGTRITAFVIRDKERYQKMTIFQRWETTAFYEWKMQSGNIIQLRQDFIHGLTPMEKRRIGMTK